MQKVFSLTKQQATNLKNRSKQSYSFDNQEFDFLIKEENLNESQQLQLKNMLSYLGFEIKENYIEYAINIEKLVLEFHENTNFFEMSQEKQEEILYKYFVLQNNKKSSCPELEACLDEAQALSTLGIIACTGSSIGVGSITGGFGGVVFQVFCLAANMDYFLAQLNSCHVNNNCNDFSD
jgi:hypothetical protein